MIHFLRWAAVHALEPLVGMADDDTFVSPMMLAALVRLITAHRRGVGAERWRHLYVGRFEWYSWHERTLVASGLSNRLGGALSLAQEGWRNCSPSGVGWQWGGWSFHEPARPAKEAEMDGRRDSCVGPFAFAKGPLLLLSVEAIQWLVKQANFARDAATSEAMARGTWRSSVVEHPQLVLETGSRFVPDDVQLGYWLSRHPTLRFVALPGSMWLDSFDLVGSLAPLLCVHKVPWRQLAWVNAHSTWLWRRRGARVTRRLGCFGPLCAGGHCAHSSGQRACGLNVKLLQRAGSTAVAACDLCGCVANSSHRRRVSYSGRRGSCSSQWVHRREEPALPDVCSVPGRAVARM